MKLKNVHYEYRGNDTWRIYFKDYAETDAFQNERTDGQKPRYGALCTNNLGIRYYVEAKLTGQFSILRRYVKDSTNDYFSNDVWRALVKKIEGADSDYIFDEIDLRYDATIDKCYFRICCMNGTWTEFFVKNMLNSQFGMVAQANGYFDTDNAYQGGLCTRRSCCGIGYGLHENKYGNEEERLIFTVKNFCNGETDIVKVSPWTNTFIGTNKETEKEYSWNDFKQYMEKLSSTGSDIWDIEWEYDETCPFTGTEIVDKLHLYLKPLAYKRLFEQEEKVKKVWISSNSLLWSNNDYLGRVQALTPPPVPYWLNLDEDSKIGFRQKDVDEVQKEIDEMTKKIYEKLEIKQVKDFDVDTAWHDYLTATDTTNNKEDNTMENKKYRRIENVDHIAHHGKNKYSIYFKDISDMKNINPALADRSYDDKFYYVEVLSDTELPKKISTIYLVWDQDLNLYVVSDYDQVLEPGDTISLMANEHFEMQMEAQLNDAQLAVWEAALGIGHTKQIDVAKVKPTKILIQGTATIIWWSDGTKTIVKCQKGDKMDPEKGIAMCVMKKFIGTNKTGSNYLDFAKPAIKDYEAKQKAMAAARKKAADKKRRAAKAKTEAKSKEES